MSKLEDAFADIIHVLHHNPSCRPFYEAVITEHDALAARVQELEFNMKALHPARPASAPQNETAAASMAVSGTVPDDSASITVDATVDTALEKEKPEAPEEPAPNVDATEASEPTPVPGAITGNSVSLSPQPDPQDAGATPAE